ncbi:MAG: hydroxymethylbilane synthase [Ruminococcus sp.]|nr:hydroxymethylbilane synthase [Ruminococcus sp.]
MKIRIGTRTSRLALVQTEMVSNRIKEKFPEVDIVTVPISTKGDRIQNKPVSEIGGSAVFTDDIEQALINKEIDLAIHSAKDLPSYLGDGLEIVSVLERADYRDAIITKNGTQIQNIPDFVIGTGSKRRILNTKKYYPKATFKVIRGNVDVRLEKLLKGDYDAIILAMAGITRLGFDKDERFEFKKFTYNEFITEPCQAIIALESRKDDFVTPVVKAIRDEKTFYAFEIERYVFEKLNHDGSVPLGAYAFTNDDEITLSLSINGKNILTDTDKIENRFKLADKLVNIV